MLGTNEYTEATSTDWIPWNWAELKIFVLRYTHCALRDKLFSNGLFPLNMLYYKIMSRTF